jgi:S1-C subfamily serine protease
VDLLDLVLIVLAVFAAIGGYRLGFLGRVASWLGLALGFYVAILILPKVIVHLATSAPGLQIFVAVLLLLGGALVGQALGLLVGFRLHRALPRGPVREVDRVVGAGVGALGVVTLLWLLLPSLAAVPGWPARAVSQSGIARWVAGNLPTPPPAAEILRRLVTNGAPEVFSALGQGGTAIGPAPTSSPLSQPVTDAVIASTVRVQGEACGEILEGSGFAVAPGLIVTNAHVVAGEGSGRTAVLLPSGTVLGARVVMFDPQRDLALLQVSGLGENPLAIASATQGELGAAFGHPEGQTQIAVVPARVSQVTLADGTDIYGSSTTRQILILAASLQHGDSGGPLVNATGQVIGVDFAISADDSNTSYALDTSELNAALHETRSPGGASTGACLTS